MPDKLPEDGLVVSWSTITTGIHLAAYMGAKNIIICGVDCGTINGSTYFKGYTEKDWISGGNNPGIKNWLAATDSINLQIRNQICKKYNCNIYSLNPFMNFNLDGNEYSPC